MFVTGGKTMPLQIVRNDITKMKVDAIVNAANNSLLGGGGVDGCIHRAAGPKLLAECRTLGGCETGSAKITKGYDLPAKYVIHAVGPVWNGGGYGEKEQLTGCYRTALAIAKDYGLESIAFPLISSGIYGYPKDQALRVAVDAIGEFLSENEMEVYIVIFDKRAYQIGRQLYADIETFIDERYVDDHTDTDREQQRRRLVTGQSVYSQALGAPDAPDQMPALEKHTGVLPGPKSGRVIRTSKKRKKDSVPERPEPEARPYIEEDISCAAGGAESLEEALGRIDESFSEMLLRKIDESGMTDAQCYKKANIDRKLFSKIRSNPQYKPSKPTVIAFAVALNLTLDETREMLMKAGFSLSRSSKFDIIIEYFIVRKNYNIYEINEALFAFDQSLLGAG